MKRVINSLKNLTAFERCLWLVSVIVVTVSFAFARGQGVMSLIASLIGVTALIFVAKGDVTGQVLTVIFSVFYAVISYTFRYYGEMITYVGMTAPMAAAAVITWLKNPYRKTEVKVNKIGAREWAMVIPITIFVTAVFYFILKAFNTANLTISTVSVTTSFLASYLTFRRSELYAAAYAANDMVLILLWVLAAIDDISYLPMILCFVMFFVNDIYGYVNWRRMRERQNKKTLL